MRKNLYILISIFLILFIMILFIIFKKQKESFVLLNKKQYKFKKTLEDMKDILDKNNITFFLYCGTCLGAQREKKFIEHDQDIDIGVLELEFNKINHIMKKYKSLFYLERHFPNNEDIKNASEITYRHRETNVSIDIFQVLNTTKGYLHYSYGSICSEKKNQRCEFINKFDFEDIIFLGKKYKTPNKDFLKSHYGNDWNVIKKFSYSDGLKYGGYKSLR